MQYAGDLVLVAESRTEAMNRFQMQKIVMESKGLRVNVDRTKVMISRVGGGDVKEESEWPCLICLKGVGCNSILCNVYFKWVHKRCSGKKGMA